MGREGSERAGREGGEAGGEGHRALSSCVALETTCGGGGGME